jgi:hypothetical protein
MDLVKTVILICASMLPRNECQPETALHVIVKHESGPPGLCGMQAQALLAASAFADDLGESTYLKVRCTLGRSTADVARHHPD